MHRSVSGDGDMFKETKLLMYSHSGKYGFITKTVMSYAKQRVLAWISETHL